MWNCVKKANKKLRTLIRTSVQN